MALWAVEINWKKKHQKDVTTYVIQIGRVSPTIYIYEDIFSYIPIASIYFIPL